MALSASDFLAFAHELADVAREITLSYFRQELTVDNKSDDSPVTIADKATEQLLRDKITQRFPEHGIIGEEQSAKIGDSAYEWILDPIDGTRSFISGYPLYGTLICLLENNEPIVSIIDIPAQNERFFATVDLPTRYVCKGKEQIACTNDNQQLSEAILFSTDYGMFSQSENQQLNPLRQAVSMVRYNGDCYLYAMLSAGWIDLVVESDLKVYDFMPLKLIVEQAGGVITDWQGHTLTKNSQGQVLAATNQALHTAALRQLSVINMME